VRGAGALVAALAAAVVWTGSAGAAAPDPWQAAADARTELAGVAGAVALGDDAAAAARLDRAGRLLERALPSPADHRRGQAQLARARTAKDDRALAAAAEALSGAVVVVAYRETLAAVRRGDIRVALGWLRVREFRPPTRFTRAPVDATVALDGLAARRASRAAALAAVRFDLLDTYDALLRDALARADDAAGRGFGVRAAQAGAHAAASWRIVRGPYAATHRSAETGRTDAAVAALALAAASGDLASVPARVRTVEAALAGFRAAPLPHAELLRRAGQLERFLRLVPIEYGRGIADGRVTLAFEVQEAITFRDGAAAALRDVEPTLAGRDEAATARLVSLVDGLGVSLAAAARGTAVALPEDVSSAVDESLRLIGELYPGSWREAAELADFDVIAAALDRLEAAVGAGSWSRAEAARLEAYGIFELGPEQRLRGLAPSLFRKIEGYFWYGVGDTPGLVQLVDRKATAAELAATRAALDESLSEAETAIGSGAGSRVSIVTNSALIVFREGLEAVLILAALMASMTGPRRRFRRPLLLGSLGALVASAVTWVVAQTVLGSLAAYGEKLEAAVSLVAIAVLLLILNWFYHRVYWQEHLQELHGRKKRILGGAARGGLVVAPVLGLAALGFSSVYREGFETVLFLQALTLEAGAVTVLEGVLVGLLATLAVGAATLLLERKLPHRKMLVATGVLITGVLVVLVGGTVQTMQAVGWLPVSPVDGLQLPYWSGMWLGVYPTWEGIGAQTAAAAFVVGSYLAAEQLRRRRRRAISQRFERAEPARAG
jgi:high-affinity iron transporter